MTTHDGFTERLSDYLDGELDAAERVSVEQHVAACDACRTALAELRAVVARAAVLADSPPEKDLWPVVAARIGSRSAPPMLSHSPGRRRFSFTLSFTLPQLAAAVLAVIVLSAGMIWMARLGGDRTDFPPVDARVQPADSDPSSSDERSVQIRPADFADGAYDQAIADLRQTLRAGRGLDAQTVSVLEANLRAIDQAIEESRAALARDPADVYLNSHLAAAKKLKLALLRRVSALTQTEG